MTSIFLIGPNNQLTELTQKDYDSEDLLQKLLADHPSLLGVTGGGGDGLILVRREFAVPESDGGADRWSLDHLFLDRSGVPVLVEVKRASDTRARREVVAQMLDYAANGVAYWPIDRLQQAYRETSAAMGKNADERLTEFLNGGDAETYWRQVEANLRSGRVRMVFVADKIAKELRRIVEFLNEQMRPAEVLAIEVEQFTNENGMRTLVPRLLGDTERAQASKSVSSIKEPISDEQWLAELENSRGEKIKAVAAQVLDWFKANGFQAEISNSQDSFSIRISCPDGKNRYPFFIRRTGNLETSLQHLKEDPAYAGDEARTALLAELKALPGVNISTTKITGWPPIPLEDIARPEVWQAFQAIALKIKAAIEKGQADNA